MWLVRTHTVVRHHPVPSAALEFEIACGVSPIRRPSPPKWPSTSRRPDADEFSLPPSRTPRSVPPLAPIPSRCDGRAWATNQTGSDLTICPTCQPPTLCPETGPFDPNQRRRSCPGAEAVALGSMQDMALSPVEVKLETACNGFSLRLKS